MRTISEKMPVLFLLGTLEIGGSESKFVSLARRLSSAGDPVHVGYLRGPFLLLDRLAGVPSVHFEQSGKWSLHAYKALRAYVRSNKIQTIVTVNPYPLSYAAIRSIKYGDKRVRVIASINTSEFLSRRDKWFMRLYSILLKRCDHIVFGSDSQRSSWIRRYRLGGDMTSVIYNGVDSGYFSSDSLNETKKELRRRLDLPLDAPVVVNVGQLRPEKGHLVLLSAFAHLIKNRQQSPFLLLVGEGSERRKIESTVNQLGIRDNVRLAGRNNDVRPFLKAADLFVLSSIAVETFSNAALEAAAMGLPIVMSDVGGSPEMFPESPECVIYPRNDKHALVSALGDSLDMIAQNTLDGIALREKVKRDFSTQAMDQHWRLVLWEQGARAVGSSANMSPGKQ